MHRFTSRDGALWCEGVKVSPIADKLGTPLYLYSLGTLLDHYRKLRSAFREISPIICFSMKANSSLALLRALAREGAGFDVVSGGELKKALRVGAAPRKIVYASVGKTEKEIAAALKARILSFNVESEQELQRIHTICRKLKVRQLVSLRLNPDVEAHTHSFISTGRRADKFGMDAQTVIRLLKKAKEFDTLEFGGIHIHIGSQILHAQPFQKAIRKALQVIALGRRQGLKIRWLNIGGGLGIVYHRETPQTAATFARAILPLLKGKGLKVILEPGRFIAGSSGILLTRVLYVKENFSKRFLVVDAGMNDLIRPSLYDAYHEIVLASEGRAPRLASKKLSKKRIRYDVVGPICESGDFLAKERLLPPVNPGDLLAVLGAGAYGYTMASNYNSRPRPAEVLISGSRMYLIRKRETYSDLVRGEQIPGFLR